MSNDRVTLTKTSEEAATTTAGKRQEDISNNEEETIQNEFVIERIVRHKKNDDGTKYFVRWYGYSPSDDTWEPPHQIPQHFVRRYWERLRRIRQWNPQGSAQD